MLDCACSISCHLAQVNASTIVLARPDRPALDLPTPEGWKAELALVLVVGPYKRIEMVYLSADSHPLI